MEYGTKCFDIHKILILQLDYFLAALFVDDLFFGLKQTNNVTCDHDLWSVEFHVLGFDQLV